MKRGRNWSSCVGMTGKYIFSIPWHSKRPELVSLSSRLLSHFLQLFAVPNVFRAHTRALEQAAHLAHKILHVPKPRETRPEQMFASSLRALAVPSPLLEVFYTTRSLGTTTTPMQRLGPQHKHFTVCQFQLLTNFFPNCGNFVLFGGWAWGKEGWFIFGCPCSS